MGQTAIRIAERPAAWTYLPVFAQETLPRYTSFPPANRFNADIGPTDAIGALRALPSDAGISLYVHVPFCRQLCWYCGCHTSVPTTANPLAGYHADLLAEIAAVARHVPAGVRVTHIHLGGGSPDILSRSQIDGLFAALRRHFHIAQFAEIAVELDPRGVKQEVVEGLAAGGVTRASLGVQVLDRQVQERINRFQPAELVAHVIGRLRAAGIESLNIDMMYGLPGQTLEHVVETATFAAMQDADRVAVFGYAHVPWFKKHQNAIETGALPGSEARFRQAEAAAYTLQHAGYVPVGFDHFAAPGDGLVTAERRGELRRNFQGYTDDRAQALIGFGASAISSLPGLMWQNAADTAQYRNDVQEGRLPVRRGVAVTEAERQTGRLIERILCDFEADIPSVLREVAAPRLQTLLAAGLIEMCGRHLTVTARGRPYVRNVAAAFDTTLATTARHSLSV